MLRRRSRTKKSPSRWRFRPPSPLAFRFRVQPPGSASTYSRSVLGARENLRRPRTLFKRPEFGKHALCTLFVLPVLICDSCCVL
jgi:hypothetical protein